MDLVVAPNVFPLGRYLVKLQLWRRAETIATAGEAQFQLLLGLGFYKPCLYFVVSFVTVQLVDYMFCHPFSHLDLGDDEVCWCPSHAGGVHRSCMAARPADLHSRVQDRAFDGLWVGFYFRFGGVRTFT